MYNWEFEYSQNHSGVIRKYYGDNKKLIIPREIDWKPVRSICSNAFRNRKKLESVGISDGVREIGGEAFQGCGAITSAVIPDGVMIISWSVFRECASLISVVIPGSVTEIKGSFINCKCTVTYKGKTYAPKNYSDLYKEANGGQSCPITEQR